MKDYLKERLIDALSKDDDIIDFISRKLQEEASTTTSGMMSSTDKTKLDGIETNAQVNPGNATTTANGLMSSTDKTRLDNAYQAVNGASIIDHSNNTLSLRLNKANSGTLQDLSIPMAGFNAYQDGNAGLMTGAQSRKLNYLLAWTAMTGVNNSTNITDKFLEYVDIGLPVMPNGSFYAQVLRTGLTSVVALWINISTSGNSIINFTTSNYIQFKGNWIFSTGLAPLSGVSYRINTSRPGNTRNLTISYSSGGQDSTRLTFPAFTLDADNASSDDGSFSLITLVCVR